MKKAIVIGAGIAGIASAIRLKAKGYAVEVFESNDYTGGKIHAFEKNGYRFDAGPSLFTMPQLVTELFQLMGEDAGAYFTYKQKEVLCNYFWEDGTIFQALSDEDKFIEKAAECFDEPKGRLRSYIERNAEKYSITHHVFLEKSLHKASTYLSLDTMKSFLQLYKLHLNKSLNAHNRSSFSNEKLVQLFDRYATYNGSSPYKTPGIMSIIPHFEMHFGTYFPHKGIHHISQSLYELASNKGVRFHLNSRVDEVEHNGKSVSAVQVNGQSHKADVVVSNMDVWNTYNKLLKDVKRPEKTLKQERSSSALIFYWGIEKEFPELDLHNILWSEHYEEEFEYLFDQKSLHPDPTIYIHISSKDKADDAPKGCENWFVMVNAPGNFGQDWEVLKKEARKNIISKLNRMLKTNLEPLIACEEVLDPVQIEDKTSSHRGSLYGASSNSQFAAFIRHPNFSRQLKNLYFCGGSAHPGGGIPLCLLSAKIVGDLVPNGS